jgi:uncharacterized NAD(P)/FAD-binding protein YdhS
MTGARAAVAIVGGGFTGAAVAFHLARLGVEADILVFEPRGRLGAGLAYGGDDPAHRVNVPASRMSLLPDDEDHFARWLAETDALGDDPQAVVGGEAYPRRGEFGRYVDAQLQPLLKSGAVRHIRASVVAMRKLGGLWRIRTEQGETFRAGLAVIATTHPTAGLPPELAPLLGDAGLIVDPLAEGALAPVGRDERVLIVGAGLTAADLVAGLEAQGHRGTITMISRRGLRSRSHPQTPYPGESDFVGDPARKATELLARVRAAVTEATEAGRSWHPVFETLRLQGGDIWRALAPDARRRVARHLRPFWDAHRFRLAPQLDALLAAKLADGSLVLRKARLGAVARRGEALAVELRDLRRKTATTETFERIVVATGPAHGDILRSQTFLGELAAHGALAPDPTGLGISASLDARAVGASGEPDATLFVAGPLARGAFGELMGLPHVALHAQFVANQLATALSEAKQRGG